MWVARDSNGTLCLYKHKPIKGKEAWIEATSDSIRDFYVISKSYFPEVKWEDEEPRELVLKPTNNE